MTEVAAFVAGNPVPVAAVDERLAALRSGPYAARLPHPGSAEGRNLRRWLVQVVTTEKVIEHEAAVRGVVADAHDPAPHPATLAEALRLGGVTATLIATHPLARPLLRHLVPTDRAPDEQTLAYYRRNRDRHPEPYSQISNQLAVDLGAAEQERRFARWLDERCAALVRLQPGFEHPADPHHPDAVHHH